MRARSGSDGSLWSFRDFFALATLLRAVVLVLNGITGRGYLLAIRTEEKQKGRHVIRFRSSQERLGRFIRRGEGLLRSGGFRRGLGCLRHRGGGGPLGHRITV